MRNTRQQNGIRLGVLLVSLLLPATLLCQTTIETTSFTITELLAEVNTRTTGGMRTSLASKLANAQAAYERGQVRAAINILGAFQNEVMAQTEQMLPSEIASSFLGQSLILNTALRNGWRLGDAVVGPEGATIQVVDPTSPIAGTVLQVPPGAFTSDQAIFLLHTSIVLPTPGFASLTGPIVDLQPSGLILDLPALLKLPYADEDQDGLLDGTGVSEDFLQVRRFDEVNTTLDLAPTDIDIENNFAVATIEHFSFYRWVNGRFPAGSVITYHFDDLPPMRDGPLTDEEVKEAVRRAMRTWEAILQSVGIRFEERSPLTFTDLEIFWGSLKFESRVTSSSLDSFAAETSWDLLFIPNFQQEIKLNERLTWTTNPGISPQTFNIEAVALHELGHVLGLSDVCVTFGCLQPPVMGANRNPGQSPELMLDPSDIAAIRKLYGITGLSQLSFARTELATGIGGVPRSVTSADFNADGNLDLAVGNLAPVGGTGSVSVMLGRGDGTFNPKTDFAIGASLLSLTGGDFNGDGKVDLAGSHLETFSVSVLLGNGDGTFGPPIDTSAGTQPSSVVAGDFNQDGRLDLAAANSAFGTVSIFLGNGNGAFGSKSDFPAGAFPLALSIADFNQDGKLDVAVANTISNTVSVLLGNGDGTLGSFQSFAADAGLHDAITSDDFNQDGNLDLVLTNRNSNTVSIFPGNGDGTFGARSDFFAGLFPFAVTTGDFDRDGKLDISVALNHGGTDTLSVLPGNGDGTFETKIDFLAGAFPHWLSKGDFNADGKLDLAVANAGSKMISILLNTSQ